MLSLSALESFFNITTETPSVWAWIALGMSVILLLCSGLASASEIAFFSLTPQHLAEVNEERRSADSCILELRERGDRLLATILIMNNLVNVGVIMLLNFFFMDWLHFGEGTEWVEFILLTVLLTFLLLLFGEIMPKIYSAQHSLAFARFAAPIFCVIEKVFYPISSVLMMSKAFTDRIVSYETESLTVDDLEKAMELTDKREIAQESQMLQGIIRFGGEMASEVMTPRVDIVDLDIKTPFPEVIKCIVENNYSRIPVYQGSTDNIQGVLYIKDLLPHLQKPANFKWQNLIRPPYFVPETKMIDDLLRDFQQNKVHIAIVVDEFGGTSGIVTMEDIIEEIVGEIDDEYDDEEKTYHRLNQNTYVFQAKTLLTDFYRITGLDDEFFADVEGDADTLAGLLLELKGEFPALHERITYGNLTFEVMEMDERRIVSIKVINSKSK
ncbi:MAG: gliding motility-associated protein GldE [Bacteroidaceae bacterium]|jgi:gliding motility-associated protein GldE|nr:gliding motility-associated protein GldE [Bacteroidaceae bacterium]